MVEKLPLSTALVYEELTSIIKTLSIWEDRMKQMGGLPGVDIPAGGDNDAATALYNFLKQFCGELSYSQAKIEALVSILETSLQY